MRQDKTENKTRIGSSIKFATIAICLGMFFWNSFAVFQQYIGRQTIISNDIEFHSKMLLPAVTLCGTRGFKEELLNYSYVEKESYISNTFDLDEMIYIIQDKDDRNFTNQDFLNINDNVKEMWNVKVTFSAYRGRCYTFEYKKEVRKLNIMDCSNVLIPQLLAKNLN